MKLKFRYTEKIIGTFLLIAVVIVFSSILFLLLNQKFFERKYVYKAKFLDAVGLSQNSPVYFKGFKIGIISNFVLGDDNYISADFEVYSDFKDKIIVKSALYKAVNVITQASTIEFLQSVEDGEILAEGSLIPAIDVPEGKQLLAQNRVKKIGDPLNSMLINLEGLVENLKKDNNPDEGALFRALVNLADAAEQLKKLSDNINRDLDKLSNKESENGALYQVVVNLNDITRDLKTTTSLTNQILKKTDLAISNYSKPDSLGIKLIDPTGENIVNPLRKTFTQLNEILPKVQSFTEYLNAQTTDITLVIDDLKTVLRQVQQTFESLNKNPLIGPGGTEMNQSYYELNQKRPK
jgi:ABC-type transporter Mla subunit MlaD